MVSCLVSNFLLVRYPVVMLIPLPEACVHQALLPPTHHSRAEALLLNTGRTRTEQQIHDVSVHLGERKLDYRPYCVCDARGGHRTRPVKRLGAAHVKLLQRPPQEIKRRRVWCRSKGADV